MARKKKSSIGYDPLAWMDDTGEAEKNHKVNVVSKKKRVNKQKVSEVNMVNKKTETGLDVDVLESSFQALAPMGESLTRKFYELLFERYPDVIPMFEGTSIEEQHKKLWAALQLVANSLRQPEKLIATLTELGKRHADYGALPAHYDAVAEILLEVMQELAGDLWTDEVQTAWSNALSTIANVMIKASETKAKESEEENKMASTQSALSSEEIAEYQQMKSAVNGAMTAMMMIDRDFKITYANKATIDLLTKNQEILRSVFPGFDASKLIGANIDMFHKNPAHQRQLLDNPANLPYQTDIDVGPLKFALNVTAIINDNGDYIGNSLEWQDVTEQRAKEIEVSRLQSAMHGAATNMMLCDKDFNITYVNPAVKNMLMNRQHELREVFPGFDANNLIGQNIDQFHKNPAHQRHLLSDISKLPFKAEISVAGVEFSVNATAILDNEGNWMGNMVEWNDITDQKDAERQIESLIHAAAAGNLEERIDVSQYDGFFKGLGEGINKLIDAVVKPIRENIRVATSLSEGDLREEMTGDFKGEYLEMQTALNQTISNLRGMVGQIQTTSTSLVSAAGEIAQGNTDLSQRTEEQASSLEETASSMEELTSTVRQNADNARQANQLAAGARDQAEQGGSVVQNAVAAMAEINSSSKKIADIIGVIDEIAFQTNLLALNAAVEAARAGEQGRGFAVVAGEVRNLAQRSAGAAKEIKTLIQDSVEKVEDGSRLVDQSGKTLAEIVGSVKKVSDIIAEIAAASQEQSAGIDQVNKAVTQMDEVTQQNAALVEEAAAASESMDEQARGLQKLMDFFKTDAAAEGMVVGGNTQASSPAPAASAAPTAPAPAARPASVARPAPTKPAAGDSDWEEF